MADGFRMLYWGFFCVLVSFRIQGIDIIPDVIGFLLIAGGVGKLLSESDHHKTARDYAFPTILLSIFRIYHPPAEPEAVRGAGVGPRVQFHLNMGLLGPIGILVDVTLLLLTLLLVYNVFMGIKEMAVRHNQGSIAKGAEQNWNRFLWLHLAYIFLPVLLFVPAVAAIAATGLFIASIALAMAIMRLMKQCAEGTAAN